MTLTDTAYDIHNFLDIMAHLQCQPQFKEIIAVIQAVAAKALYFLNPVCKCVTVQKESLCSGIANTHMGN